MSQLQLDYVAGDALDGWRKALARGPAPRRILGMALFGSSGVPATPGQTEASLAHPWPHVALPVLEAGADLAEVWSVPNDAPAIEQGEIAGVRYARSGDLVFAWLTAPLTAQLAESSTESPTGPLTGPLTRQSTSPAHALEDITSRAYDAVFSALRELDCPHPLRFWNYLPDILGEAGGTERYRLFNMGRHASFARHAPAIEQSPPAACALGHPEGIGGPLTVYAIASRQPGRPVENPRQVSAYRYPRQYGPRSPTFSRATVAAVGREHTLFISGTASIVGHESVHLGDVRAQTQETLDNIEALLNRIESDHPGPAWRLEDLQLKAYVREVADLPAVREVIIRRLGSSVPCHYLHAVVCRSDLLVEIEASAAKSL